MIVPTDATAAVREVMERHGRTAAPIYNPSIRKVLRENERQYLTTRGHCDCGTVLAHRPIRPEELENKLDKERSRLKRKGWSVAKIARAIEDQCKAETKRREGGPDSLELWSDVLNDVRDELKLPYVGLFVRSYSGAIATEIFDASRREVCGETSWLDALASLVLDEVTILR